MEVAGGGGISGAFSNCKRIGLAVLKELGEGTKGGLKEKRIRKAGDGGHRRLTTLVGAH